ncbi:MAG: peptidyl-prolyl cis-trans isomerase [Planctomycetes bacterium]|nr:peptidyl-prolyl cis-trans isomerase [Planctomycetota bacterium]
MKPESRLSPTPGNFKSPRDLKISRLRACFLAALILGFCGLLPLNPANSGEWELSEAVHTLVNGEPIFTGEIVELRLLMEQAYANAGQEITLELLQQFDLNARRALIHSLLIRQEARKNSISVSEEEINDYLKTYNIEDTELNRRQAEDNLLFDAVLRAEMMPTVEPTPREMTEYYKKHKEKYSIPRLIQARHITVPKASPETRARELRMIQRIKEEAMLPGADFVEVAMKHGATTSDRETGGGIFFPETKGLGFYFPPASEQLQNSGLYPPEMIRAFITLKAHTISDIVESPRGFHLLYIENERPEKIYAFQEVQIDIFNSITYRKREVRKREWLIGIINRSHITWHNGDEIPVAEIVPLPIPEMR